MKGSFYQELDYILEFLTFHCFTLSSFFARFTFIKETIQEIWRDEAVSKISLMSSVIFLTAFHTFLQVVIQISL